MFKKILCPVIVLLFLPGLSNTFAEPIQTTLLPQPADTKIWIAAVSPTSGRIAVSAGPDEEKSSLYVNSPDVPNNFRLLWSPGTEVHAVGHLTWSPGENSLAFIGMSGNRTTDTGEIWIYILDVSSDEIRKVLKILEADHGQEHRLVNVRAEGTRLAWFGKNKVCMCTRDESIIAVDISDGSIETLVPEQDGNISSLVSVSLDRLRFIKKRPSQQDYKVEVCEFNGSEVVSLGKIPISPEKILISNLSTDGRYTIVIKKSPEQTFGEIDILEISKMVSVKEIPVFAKSNSRRYMYIPLTVLKGNQLILIQQTRLEAENARGAKQELVKIDL